MHSCHGSGCYVPCWFLKTNILWVSFCLILIYVVDLTSLNKSENICMHLFFVFFFNILIARQNLNKLNLQKMNLESWYFDTLANKKVFLRMLRSPDITWQAWLYMEEELTKVQSGCLNLKSWMLRSHITCLLLVTLVAIGVRKKSLKIFGNLYSEPDNQRRTGNTMAPRRGTNWQTVIYKTLTKTSIRKWIQIT